MEDLKDIDHLYSRVLTAGFIMLQEALDANDTEWAKAEVEFLHNIPSLIGEKRWPRHDYFINEEWKAYTEWTSSPVRKAQNENRLTFYNRFIKDISELITLRATTLPPNQTN